MEKDRKEKAIPRRLIKMIWENAKGLTAVSLVRELIQTAVPYVTLLFGAQITELLTGGLFEEAVRLVIQMSLCLLGMKCAENLLSGFENQWSAALEMQTREKMNRVCYASKLEELESYEFQQRYQQAKDGLEYSGGIHALILCCGTILADAVRIGLTAAFLAELMVRTDSRAGRGMVLALGALLVLCSFLRVRNNRKIFEEVSRFYEKLAPYNHQLQYFFYELCADKTAGKDVRAYHLQSLIRKREEESHREVLGFLKKITGVSAKYHTLNAMLEGVLWGAAYFLMTFCCLAERLGLGEILKYTGIVNQVSQAFSSLLNAAADARFKMNFLEQYLVFVKDCPGEETKENRAKNRETEEEICCRGVSYRYAKAEADALRGVSLKIRKGSQVAVVGENGSGKSTLLKLLMGLYTPQEGTVTVFGEEPGLERKQFAAVFQDFTVYPVTVEQNLTFCAESKEERREAAWKALEKLGLKRKAEGLPLGIDTTLRQSDSGQVTGLSGGEEQKLALARAVFADRPVYVLDEPSAALDIRSELELYQMFRELTEEKTVIFVSHRLFSCRQCDWIFVMDGGRLVQEGTHEQLVKERGKYREMWESQVRDFGESGAEA